MATVKVLKDNNGVDQVFPVTRDSVVYDDNNVPISEYVSMIGSGTLNTTAQTIVPAINELNEDVSAKPVLTYIEPTFSSGLADYDMSSKLSAQGWTTLRYVIAQINSGSITTTYIRSCDIMSSTSLRMAMTSSAFSGVIGVFVLFLGE